MPKASEISDSAAEWLIRLEGQTTPALWDSFQIWLDEDARHRAAFVRLREAWARVDKLKTLRPVDGTIDCDLLDVTKIHPSTVAARGLQPLRGKPRPRPEEVAMPDRRRFIAAGAAIAATGVLAWFGAYHLGWESYETTVGGRTEIQLADGSFVDLNTNTELNVRITGSRREIMLMRGEALFHVAHDSSRPFYVTAAGGTVVRAVGTAFSVRIRDSEHVEVLVAEGRVAVAAPGREANFENPSLLVAAPKVSAGEAANVRRNEVSSYSVPQTDITRRLAWTTGYLVFQGETIGEAVREFKRYNDRQITIADPAIVNLQFGGRVRTQDLDSFLAVLQSFDVQVVSDSNGNIRLFRGGKPP